MSLSGNLGFVPIDDVLRLLTRSGQKSSVEISGRGLFGRIFVANGGIDLAATVKDGEIHRLLMNSDSLEADTLRRIASAETTLAAVAADNKSVVELLREMTVESIYRITQGGEDFQVREGVTSPYASPRSFDLDDVLRDAEARQRDWEGILDIIPDLRQTIVFNRKLADRDEIVIKSDDWKVLSVIGTGSSVLDISDALGTTEFWAASVASRLVKYELLLVSDGQVTEEHEVDEVESAEAFESVEEFVSVEEFTFATSDTPALEEDEPADEAGESLEMEVPGEPADIKGEATEDGAPHNESWWREPKSDDDEADSTEVEEDTEAFLEKVFSELDSDEGDQGHGLLRRRRLGTLRDFSSDS